MQWECECPVFNVIVSCHVGLVLLCGGLMLLSSACILLHDPRKHVTCSCCATQAPIWFARLLYSWAAAVMAGALWVAIIYLEHHALFMAEEGYSPSWHFPTAELHDFMATFFVLAIARAIAAIRVLYSLHVLWCLPSYAPPISSLAPSPPTSGTPCGFAAAHV